MVIAMLGYVLAIVWGIVMSITTVLITARAGSRWVQYNDCPSKFDYVVVSSFLTLTVVLWWAVWALYIYIW